MNGISKFFKGVFEFMLCEGNGIRMSIRKFLGILTGISFNIAIIKYGEENGWKELPQSYLIIISGVFLFYFAKETIRNIKIGTNSKPSNQSDEQTNGG